MAILYRAHYAMVYNPLTTSTGIHTSAIFGFMNSLIKLLKEENPDYLAITMDTKAPTFRHKRYTEYKANRKQMPEELQEQIPIFYNLIEMSNIPMLKLNGYEADDILGTVVKNINNDSIEKYIVSGDKDLMQLVDETIKVYSPGNKFKPNTIYDNSKVLDKWGINSSEMIDYLALVGDVSDNIPGVAGVGPKTAVKLIKEYNTLEQIYDSLDLIKNEKLKEKLKTNKDKALLSKELVTIDINVPLKFDLDAMECSKIDFNNIQKKLNDLEIYAFDSFFSATSLFEENPRKSNKNDIKKEYILIDNEDILKSTLSQIKSKRIISIDLETDNIISRSANIVGISLSWSIDTAYYVPIISQNKNNLDIQVFLDLMKPFFENIKYKFIGQNIKYDIIVFRRYGVEIKNIYFDTMIAESLIAPEKNRYNLSLLAEKYLDYKMQDIEELIGTGKNQITMDEVDIDKILFYACEDADVTFQIYQKQKEILNELKLDKLFYDIEMPLVTVLSDMEYNGVYVDTKIINDLSSELKKELEMISKNIHDMSGKEFNINSPKQLAEVLFDELELKQFKKRSTASDILQRLRAHHPIAEHLLNYRHLNKLVNTYLDKLPNYINPDSNRIHTSFNQVVTSTGRLSSTKPNFQNIPIKTEVGRKIRKAFKVENDDFYIFSCDYSQIELRILAHYSKEQVLIDSFNDDLDIHNKTASLIFNKDENKINFDERRIAKTINYSIIYGAGPYRISQELKIPIKNASEIINNYFSTYPKIKNYIDSTIESGINNECVKTLNGRIRKTYNLKSDNRNIVEAEKRAIINMPIQGTASELIKIAMINIYKRLKEEKLKSKMILQIHDELLFEVSHNEIEKLQKLVVEEMQNAIPLDVPIKVDYNYDKDWLGAH